MIERFSTVGRLPERPPTTYVYPSWVPDVWQMNDQEIMAVYGIRSETKTVYHVDGYRYDNLSDAVNYAKEHPDRAVEHGEHPSAPSTEPR